MWGGTTSIPCICLSIVLPYAWLELDAFGAEVPATRDSGPLTGQEVTCYNRGGPLGRVPLFFNPPGFGAPVSHREACCWPVGQGEGAHGAVGRDVRGYGFAVPACKVFIQRGSLNWGHVNARGETYCLHAWRAAAAEAGSEERGVLRFVAQP